MRSTVPNAVFWIALALPLAAAAGEPSKRMCDPLVALCFDPGKVRFETLPKLPQPTPALEASTQWIFASSAEPAGATLYVVSGFQKVHADCDEAVPEEKCPSVVQPGFGAVVRVADGKVELLGVPDTLLATPTPDDNPVAEPLVGALWCDAAKRFVKAFGGAKAFAKAAAAQDVQLTQQPAPFVECLKAAGVQVKKPARQGRAARTIRSTTTGTRGSRGRDGIGTRAGVEAGSSRPGSIADLAR